MSKQLEFPSSSFTGIGKTTQPQTQRPRFRDYSKCTSTPTANDDHEGMSQQDQEKDSEFRRIRRDYRALRNRCLELGIKYTDEDFPASVASLGHGSQSGYLQRREIDHKRDHNDPEIYLRNMKSVVSWQRPGNISLSRRGNDKSEEDWVLFKDAHPSDILQGELGNCWFIAALTLISERRELISKIFITRRFNSTGVYALRLFKDGQWKGVIIDDLFPCDIYNRLVFSSCKKKQLWIPLIEKAMSKLHGSYASLQSGHISDGLNYLTGFISERIDFKSEQDQELLWARLLSFYEANFLMGAHITSDDAAQIKYYKESKGLVANHVYSVLRVVSMEENRLIQLRNPWGRFCWKGDWSDESPLWTDTLSAYLSPHRSDEGIFWMSYRDLFKIFAGLEVCKIRQNWKIYSVEGILPPYADQDCQPCFELVCNESCEVDISLYQSSKRNARENVKQTEIGFMVIETNGAISSSKRFRLVKPVDLTLSCRQRFVSCNLMLKAGSYCLVPFSFGHWTPNKREEIFYNVALTVHSSRDLKIHSIHPSNILADALICCSRYFGDRQYFPLSKKADEISVISMNLGYGYCTVLENNTENMLVELEVKCKTTGDYISTRNTFRTQDKIPPLHCQVVQILVPQETGRACNYSYKLQSHDSFSLLRLDDRKDVAHQPPINERIAGLHTPRRN